MTCSHLKTEDIPEVGREGHIVKTDATTEERCDFADSVASNATAYTCDEEVLLRMLGGKLSESLYCCLHTLKTFHRGNGVTLSLKSFTLTPYSTEFVHSYGCSTTGMETTGVTAEDKYLVGGK